MSIAGTAFLAFNRGLAAYSAGFKLEVDRILLDFNKYVEIGLILRGNLAFGMEMRNVSC